MSLTVFDPAEYLTDAESIFYYLELELREPEIPYMASALGDVVRARGGYQQLALECGVPAAELEHTVKSENELPVAVMQKVMQAFQPSTLSAKVA